jgi:hypothetical protein
MDFNRNTAPIVVDGDGAIFAIDVDSDVVHVRVTDFVVCSVDQDLVKNLVKTRDNLDVPIIRCEG